MTSIAVSPSTMSAKYSADWKQRETVARAGAATSRKRAAIVPPDKEA